MANVANVVPKWNNLQLESIPLTHYLFKLKKNVFFNSFVYIDPDVWLCIKVTVKL